MRRQRSVDHGASHPDLRAVLLANAAAHAAGAAAHDPAPVLKLFNPVGAATWLATELDMDGDTLFGLADLGFGCPELGYFSLSEIAALRLPFGPGIERDLGFSSAVPLSVWAEPPKVPTMRGIVGMAAEGDAARRAGSILAAAQLLRPVEARHRALAKSADFPGDPALPEPDPLSPCDEEGG